MNTIQHDPPLGRTTYDVVELPTRTNPRCIGQVATVGFGSGSGTVHLTMTEAAAAALASLVLKCQSARSLIDLDRVLGTVDEQPWRQIADDLLGVATAVTQAPHITRRGAAAPI